jgi:tetratricopeptide (TPR) repeat protein
MDRTGSMLVLLLATLATACGSAPSAPDPRPSAAADAAAPAAVIALSGRRLLPPPSLPGEDRLQADLAAARAHRDAHPDDPQAWIWLGRRLGYLWRYHEAIEVFGQALQRWPDDAGLLRHRGHRFITVRDFAAAQADLERAAALVAGRADQVEPDGAPNAAGIPRTTLAYNIHYHLALARYLQGDVEGAVGAWRDALVYAGNDDARVAATDWLWMSLMRLGRDQEAARLLEAITPAMDILENHSYHRRLLMYRGLATAQSLLDDGGDAVAIATQGYGVGNWHLVQGRRAQALAAFDAVLAGPGWNAFGFIAAEADRERLR